MATSIRSLEEFLTQWKGQVGHIFSGPRPTFVFSLNGLSEGSIKKLETDYSALPYFNGISTIISIKMMHIYFRIGQTTYDYRPHRGPFSSLTSAPYRAPKSDRVEVLTQFSKVEMENLFTYMHNIQNSRSKVLGEAHPLQISDHDYTVRSHETIGSLDCNLLTNRNERHNCLTWFTTAPIGENGEKIHQLLGMKDIDFETEAHSYIVAFHRFLLKKANAKIAGTIVWTQKSLHEALKEIKNDSEYLVKAHAAL